MNLTLKGNDLDLEQIRKLIEEKYAGKKNISWQKASDEKLEAYISKGIDTSDSFWKSLLNDYSEVSFSGSDTTSVDEDGFWENLELIAITNEDGTREFKWLSGSSGWA
jgi:hypothetical protein